MKMETKAERQVTLRFQAAEKSEFRPSALGSQWRVSYRGDLVW